MADKSGRPPSNSWWPELLTHLAMASGIGYLAVSYTVSRWLTRASPRAPQTTPTDFGLPCEQLECWTADGLRLVGWVVEPPRPWATLALFHGLRHNREKMLGRIAFLAAQGVRCVAFDHRAHGESDGKRSSFGFFESRDVVAVLDLVRQRWPHQPRAALGVSMGAAAICFAAKQLRDCHAFVLESCYVDVGTAFANRLRNGYPAWYKRLSRGVVWMSERRLGIRLSQLVPANHIGDLAPAPVLVLTGTEDHHAPPLEARRLYECCQEPREFWLVPGAGHKDVFETGSLSYQQLLLDFLTRRLPKRSPLVLGLAG